LAAHGITGFVDKAGHNWNMRRYAKVLAQETTNGAFRQGTINRLEEKGHDLVRISSHAGSCKLCQPYQGQTFSLTGEDKEFPALSSAKGLFHVGCLHVISLAPEEKDRFIGRLQGKEGADVRAAEIKRLAEKAGWKGDKSISSTQMMAAHKKVAGITSQILEREWGLSSVPYHEKSLEFLRDQAERRTPMSEKQMDWMRKLIEDAKKSRYATPTAKVYLSEKVLRKIGL
jgi:hypothetical protein